MLRNPLGAFLRLEPEASIASVIFGKVRSKTMATIIQGRRRRRRHSPLKEDNEVDRAGDREEQEELISSTTDKKDRATRGNRNSRLIRTRKNADTFNPLHAYG